MNVPLDLRSIATHAQAEALVAKTRTELLEMPEEVLLASPTSLESSAVSSPMSLSSAGTVSPGGLSLAAQLALYGETLALERRFKRGEAQRQAWAMKEEGSDDDVVAYERPYTGFGVVQRKGSSPAPTASGGPYFVNRRRVPGLSRLFMKFS
jgi:hypothetical protein